MDDSDIVERSSVRTPPPRPRTNEEILFEINPEPIDTDVNIETPEELMVAYFPIDTSSDESKSDDSDDNSVVQVRRPRVGTVRRRSGRSYVKCCLLYFTFVSLWIINIIVAFVLLGALSIPPQNSGNQAPDELVGPLRFVLRSVWDTSKKNTVDPFKTYHAKRVAVIQTDTRECDTVDECTEILLNIQRNSGDLQYNFMITPNAYVYEILGWNEPSRMFRDEPTMVIAFLGEYEKKQPTIEQLDQFTNLIMRSEELGYLNTSFTMFGKKTRGLPIKLFDCLSTWQQWDVKKSDSDLVYVDDEQQLMDDMYIPW